MTRALVRVEERALALPEPSAAQLAGIGAWLQAVRQRAENVDTRGFTWLVLSPFALRDRRALATELAALGVAVRGRTPLHGWSRISTAFRVTEPDPSLRRLRATALFESAWDALCPGAPAEAWALAPGGDHARVAKMKQTLRSWMQHLRADFGQPGMEGRVFSPFHLADVDEADDEARRLVAAVGLLASAIPPPATIGRART
jgi:hypothetical protein